MSILSSLVRAYEHMENRPNFGFSLEKVSFVISLNQNGKPAGKPVDIRLDNKKKKIPRSLSVPQPPKRTAGIKPCFLWDKTSYVLGITAGEGKRTEKEHQAFIDYHREALQGTFDKGLKAFLGFLDFWQSSRFEELGWPEEMMDQNVVFALEEERLGEIYLHDRAEAQNIWASLSSSEEGEKAICLVTGKKAPVARLHPSIKGVFGAQSAGASIVSFNLNAFTSYGHEQGANAPVSEYAAFAYTTALNSMLAATVNAEDSNHHERLARDLESTSSERRSNRKRNFLVANTTTVFWAEARDNSQGEQADLAEAAFNSLFNDIDDEKQSKAVGDLLRRITEVGADKPEIDLDLQKVRFFILGLAPNAARISIRYWYEDTFGHLIENYRHFLKDMHIEPPFRNRQNVPLWRYLVETAVQQKRENVPPILGGQWMQAILTGGRYPATLFSTVMMRIRSDREVNTLRASMLKAVLVRNFKMEEVPVALDISNKDKGYLLGRLFAVYERIQRGALGDKINASVRDKFFGSACSQPQKVFPLLAKNSINHLSKIGKDKKGVQIYLEKDIAAITDMFDPADDPFPKCLSDKEQGMFVIGYYHQQSKYFESRKDAETRGEESVS